VHFIRVLAHSCVLPSLLGLLGASALAAETGSPSARRFYLDSRTHRHFCDANPTFALRPTGDARYREKIELALDEGPFEPYTGRIAFDKEGAHRVRFRTQDPRLNWSPTQEFFVYADLTPPLTQGQWQGPSAPGEGDLVYVAPQSRFVVLAQDYLSGVNHVRWEEGGRESALAGSISPKGEGLHQARFAAVDNVGNMEKWNDVRYFLDSKPPVTQASLNGPTFKTDTLVYAGNGSQVVLSARDEGSGVDRIEFQYNGGPTTQYRHPIALFDPKIEIRFRALDRVGNAETWKTLSVVQDPVPPRLAIERSGVYLSYGGRIYATPGFTLTLSAKDDESGLARVTYTRNGKDWETLAQHKVVFSQPGEYRFQARAFDRAGNSVEGDSYLIEIDNQPPKSLAKLGGQPVAALEPGSALTVQVPAKLEIEGEDTGVGMDRIEVSYDGKTFAPLAGPIDFATWNVSRRTVWYRAVDRLKNREPAHALPLRVQGMGTETDLFVETQALPDVPLSQVLRNSQGKEVSR
jgi:hypothetical protein